MGKWGSFSKRGIIPCLRPRGKVGEQQLLAPPLPCGGRLGAGTPARRNASRFASLLCARMLAVIEFDDERRFDTKEINYIGPIRACLLKR